MVLLRRKLDRPVAIEERDASGQHRLSFATIDPRGKAWEFAALVTSRTPRSSRSDNSTATARRHITTHGDFENQGRYGCWLRRQEAASDARAAGLPGSSSAWQSWPRRR